MAKMKPLITQWSCPPPPLTDVDPTGVASHQKEGKDMERNEVDDEDVPSPS